MPYMLVRVRGGYKVKKRQPGPPVFFSRHPLTKEMAAAQMRALYASERQRPV